MIKTWTKKIAMEVVKSVEMFYIQYFAAKANRIY